VHWWLDLESSRDAARGNIPPNLTVWVMSGEPYVPLIAGELLGQFEAFVPFDSSTI
jgi:hypothetical protein